MLRAAGVTLLNLRRGDVSLRDRPRGQMVPGRQDRRLSGRPAGRRLRQQRLQRLSPGRARSRTVGHLLLLELGSQHDDDPAPAGDRDQGRRHRLHGPSGRRRHRSADRQGLRRRASSSPPPTPPCPRRRRSTGPQGMGYVGAPNHAAGYALGAEAAKRAGLKSGDEAFVWGLKGQGGDRGSAHGRRDRGARKGGRQGHLSGDRHGDRRRSERRHRDLRRRDEGQSGHQGGRHRSRRR